MLSTKGALNSCTHKNLYALTPGSPESNSCHMGGGTGVAFWEWSHVSVLMRSVSRLGSLDQPLVAQRRIINGSHSLGLGQGVSESLCKLCLVTCPVVTQLSLKNYLMGASCQGQLGKIL